MTDAVEPVDTSAPAQLVRVLDHGFVELVEALGDDRRCVAAARVSFRRDQLSLTSDKPEQLAKDQGLIERLMRDRHTSPFEHAVFQFRIRAPIFVVRQWFRHRFASYNEESGRYVELQDEFHVPEALRIPVGKTMDYRFERLDSNEESALRDRIRAHTLAARALYEDLLAAGVAREQARLVLPVSQFTTFFWTVNALSLMNFLYLRNAIHAQSEIRAYAAVLEDFFQQRMPWTQAAFRKHWGAGAVH